MHCIHACVLNIPERATCHRVAVVVVIVVCLLITDFSVCYVFKVNFGLILHLCTKYHIFTLLAHLLPPDFIDCAKLK